MNNIVNSLCEKYNVRFEANCDMSAHTTFKIGGAAEFALFPLDTDAFIGAVSTLSDNGIKFMTVGNGSNLLFSDEGYDGVVIITTQMKNIRADGNRIYADAGAPLTKTAIAARDASLTGFEFAYGIPASIGGAVYMNAGAYGGEISGVLTSCRAYDTVRREVITFENADCDFSYRNSIFEKSGARYHIIDAVFELSAGDKEEISETMNDLISRRREKQPLEYPSAGSAFKRLDGYFTAKLIDDAGLKGYSIGGAEVSTKHAGFIINKGNATAKDVRELCEYIQKVIFEKYGQNIEREIRIV